jgi:hypothetical protein
MFDEQDRLPGLGSFGGTVLDRQRGSDSIRSMS